MKTDNRVRRGIGSHGSRLISILSERPDEVFTVKEAQELTEVRGARLRKILFDLEKSGWIHRIERAKYLINPLNSGWKTKHGTHPFLIARKLIDPYYIGFASALNYYGFTEQIATTTYVASIKNKRPLHFQSQEYRFIKLAEKRFFGARSEWMGKVKVNISDEEKTIVDCLFLPKYSGGLTEVAKAFREKLNYHKLYDYAVRMESQSVIKRLGYILETANLAENIVKQLRQRVEGSYSLLDASGPKKGTANSTWRIIENINRADLLVEL